MSEKRLNSKKFTIRIFLFSENPFKEIYLLTNYSYFVTFLVFGKPYQISSNPNKQQKINKCSLARYNVQWLVGFPAKWGNHFAKIFFVFASIYFVKEKKEKFCEKRKNFRYFLLNCRIFCLFVIKFCTVFASFCKINFRESFRSL